MDRMWKKLSAGGGKVQCGWLKDKFGLSWQIVPSILGMMLSDKDPRAPTASSKAVMKMKKLEIKGLKKAYGRKA